MTETIAGHYCGQTQPHAAHAWQTPPIYGATSLTTVYQCAGVQPVRVVELAPVLAELDRWQKHRDTLGEDATALLDALREAVR